MTEQEFSESMKHRLEKGYILPGQMEALYTCLEIAGQLEQRRSVALLALEQKIKEVTVRSRFFSRQGRLTPTITVLNFW